jgi:hypothetical protein
MRQRHFVMLLTALLVSAPGCASSSDDRNEVRSEVRAAFERWTMAAGSGDRSVVAGLICEAPSSFPESHDPIDATSTGFGSPNDLNINTDGATAIVDFTTNQGDTQGEMSDVFVHLVREDGRWKICSVQITAPGGVG